MTILKTELKHAFGHKQNLPFVGKVDVSAEGMIEVEDDVKAQQLHDTGCGYSIVEAKSQAAKSTTKKAEKEEAPETIAPQVVATEEIGKETVDQIEEQVTDSTPLGEETVADTKESEEQVESKETAEAAIRTAFEEISASDLKEIAKDAGLPGGEWRSKNKADLIEYLIEKKITPTTK